MKDKFELKKDICTPDYYIRAGRKKTKKQWLKLFPNAFTFKSNEWFIDLSVKEKANVGIVVNDIVEGVFKKMGLHSITYKDAAVESIRMYAKIHNALHQQALADFTKDLEKINKTHDGFLQEQYDRIVKFMEKPTDHAEDYVGDLIDEVKRLRKKQ